MNYKTLDLLEERIKSPYRFSTSKIKKNVNLKSFIKFQTSPYAKLYEMHCSNIHNKSGDYVNWQVMLALLLKYVPASILLFCYTCNLYKNKLWKIFIVAFLYNYNVPLKREIVLKFCTVCTYAFIIISVWSINICFHFLVTCTRN